MIDAYELGNIDIIHRLIKASSNYVYSTEMSTFTAGGGAALQGSGTYTQDTGTIQFANSNGITFGLSSGQMTGSVETNYQSTGAYLTTAMLSNASSTLAGTGTSATNASITLDSAGLAISVADPGAGGTSIVPGDYLSSSLNGSTLSLSVTGLQSAGAYLTTAAESDHTHDYQSTGAYLTTAMVSDAGSLFQSTGEYLTTAAVSDHTHGDLYIPLGNSTYYLSSNLSSVFQTAGAYLTTAMQSVCTSVLVPLANSTQWGSGELSNTFQTTGAYLTTAANSTHSHGGVSLSLSKLTGTYSSASNGLTLSLTGIDGNVAFVDSNGITFGNSIDGISTTVTASYNSTLFLDTGATASFVYTSASSLFQHTTATSAVTSAAFPSANTTKFAGSGTTIGATNDTLLKITLDSNGLNMSVPAWITTYSGGGHELLLAGNTDGTVEALSSGTVTVVGGDNITLSQDGNIFSIIGAASGTGAGIAIQAGSGGTYGATDVVSDGTVSLCGAGGILVSQYENEFVIMQGSHTHSDLYIALANSTDYATSVLSGTFQTTGAYLTTAMVSDNTSIFQYLSDSSLSLGTGYTTHTHDYQSTGAYLTTAMQSASSSVFVKTGATTGTTSGTDMKLTANTDGVSLAFPKAITTAAVSSHTHGSAPSITGSVSVTSSSNAWSISIPAFITTAMQSVCTSVLMPLSQSSAFQTATLAGTFMDKSYSSAFQTATLSNTFQTTGAYLTTAALSTHSHGDPTLALTNLTGTTASASNGMTLSLSGPSHGNVYYVDSNGFSFSSSVDGVSTSIFIYT